MLRLLPLICACLFASCTAPSVSVMNWNTYHLFNHQEHVEEASAWLAEQGPDIAAFQEMLYLDAASWQERSLAWGHEHAVLHKESGYPVALSSRFPIEVIERRVEGFHHGYLHARTGGFDVLVVHFWPTKPHEAEEVALLAERLVSEGRSVLVLGDFNAPTRNDIPHFDALGYEGETIDGQKRLDFRMTDVFLRRGFVDLVHQHAPEQNYTFSSPALIPRWRENLEEVYAARRRIDFVLADSATAERVQAAAIETDDATVGNWSDHYPMWFRIDAR